MPPPRLPLVVCTLLVAGCATLEERTPPTTPGPEAGRPPAPLAFDVLEERFDHHERLPEGWNSGSGAWTIVRDPSAPSPPNVLRGSAEPNASASLRAPLRFAEFDATVFFRIDAGDGGAGVVFGQDADHHEVVLYTTLDSTWRLITLDHGQPTQLAETPAPGASEGWIALRVLLQGARLQAWHDAALVLDVTKSGELRAGELGAFVAEGTTASFDDLRVEPLTR